MEQFIGTSGTIYASGALAVVIKSIQADVNDPSVTDVGITASGSTGTIYTVNGITPTVSEFRFVSNEDVTITSSGSLNNAIINYVYAGAPYANKYVEAAREWANRPGYRKWNRDPSS